MFFRADKTAAEEKEEKEERERSEGKSKALFFIMRYQPCFVMRAISTSTGGGGWWRVAEGEHGWRRGSTGDGGGARVAEGGHGWRRGSTGGGGEHGWRMRLARCLSALSSEVKPGWTRFIAG